MRLRVYSALAAIALALSAYAQHGARGGLSGHGGISSNAAGFSGHPGFSGLRGFSRSAPFVGNGGFMRPGSGRFAPPASSGFRIPYQARGFAGREFAQSRPNYRSGFGDHNYGWNVGRGHDGRYRPRFAYGYNYGYPGPLGYPYPYVIDPGFYDWGDSGGYNDNAQGSAPNYPDAPPYADYGPESHEPVPANGQVPQPAYGQAPPAPAPMARQPYAGSVSSPSSAPEVGQPLTVIFKNGRLPETMQNYMMNSKTLTDLDRQHYEQIPLDQIDMAETEQTNRSRGVDFQAPAGSRE